MLLERALNALANMVLTWPGFVDMGGDVARHALYSDWQSPWNANRSHRAIMAWKLKLRRCSAAVDVFGSFIAMLRFLILATRGPSRGSKHMKDFTHSPSRLLLDSRPDHEPSRITITESECQRDVPASKSAEEHFQHQFGQLYCS